MRGSWRCEPEKPSNWWYGMRRTTRSHDAKAVACDSLGPLAHPARARRAWLSKGFRATTVREWFARTSGTHAARCTLYESYAATSCIPPPDDRLGRIGGENSGRTPQPHATRRPAQTYPHTPKNLNPPPLPLAPPPVTLLRWGAATPTTLSM